MKMDRAEKRAHWTAAGGAVVLLVVIFQGLWKATGQRKGSSVGHPLPSSPSSFWLYVVMSFAAILPLKAIWRPLPLILVPRTRLVSLVTGTPLYFTGLGLMIWGRSTLGEMYNVSSSLGVQLFAGHRLITTGPYALVRHPMYLGGQIAAIGALLIYRTWAMLLMAVTFSVFMLRARREEEVLSAQFGDEWFDYSRRVPFWFPAIHR